MTADYGTRLPANVTIPDDAEFELLIDAFLSRYGTSTRNEYGRDIALFRQWCETHAGGLHPFHARRMTIEAYVRYLSDERGNVARSVNRRLISLRQFFEYALDDDYVMKNPCRNVRMARPKLDLSKKVHLNREETQRFLRAAYDSSAADYAMCGLMAYLGMRVSEVCELNVPDVLHYSKGHRVITFIGKGGDPAALPQPPVIMRALDAVIETLEDKQGALFIRRDGTRMTRRSADRVVKRIANKAAIVDMVVSPHTLRHGAIANAIDAGIPLREVQLAARHRDISTTIRIYDRGRLNLDTHASHGLAAYLGSVA
ncbi:tyrosine-type recombinase/integrase [Rhodococcoides fascians]|uniref:tyrosine-type recombinase/integrase n=1 Tax=Rhodococcoides fascians TaxID=1828 RepID=UPI00050C36F0|nr:tyrosine-type recombinase/integrase [Rhodococcus fascians]